MRFTFTVSILIFSLSSPVFAASKLAAISSEQDVAIQNNLIPKTKDKKLIEAVSQAKEVIYNVLKFESCLTNYDGSEMNIYAAPGVTYPNFNYSPIMSKTLKHIKDSCLSVTKIQDWKLLSKNSLSFEVVFLANDSGEAAKNKYEFQLQSDESWQLKNRFY